MGAEPFVVAEQDRPAYADAVRAAVSFSTAIVDQSAGTLSGDRRRTPRPGPRCARPLRRRQRADRRRRAVDAVAVRGRDLGAGRTGRGRALERSRLPAQFCRAVVERVGCACSSRRVRDRWAVVRAGCCDRGLGSCFGELGDSGWSRLPAQFARAVVKCRLRVLEPSDRDRWGWCGRGVATAVSAPAAWPPRRPAARGGRDPPLSSAEGAGTVGRARHGSRGGPRRG